MRAVSLDNPPILVGHSLATVVVADLAVCVLCSWLDHGGWRNPSCQRSCGARQGNRSARLFSGLAGDDGWLPDGQNGGSIIEQIGYRHRFSLLMMPMRLRCSRMTKPRVPAAWFDDTIDLAPWAQTVLRDTSRRRDSYDHSAEDAEARGWPLLRFAGHSSASTLQPVRLRWLLPRSPANGSTEVDTRRYRELLMRAVAYDPLPGKPRPLRIELGIQ